MATNFAEAFLSARNNAQDRTRQQQQDAMQRQQFDLQMQGAQQKQQASQQEALYGLAKGYKDYLGKNPQGGAAYYENFLRPSLAGLGLGDSGPYNEAETISLADQVLAAYSGGKATNPYEGLPSDIQSLQLLRDNPELATLDRERRQAAGMVPKSIQTSQGYGWGTPGGAIELAPITGVAGGGQIAEPQQLFAALGQKYGLQPTSVQRTPQRNAEVGGKPNSYHLSGQAADWVVPQAQKAQFMQDARANGYEAIDEGDHIHIEPAGRGGQTSIAQPYSAPKAPSELERRIEAARAMGASEDEIKRMVIGGSSARDAQRISSKDATTARQKVTQIQTARNQLKSAMDAFEKIRNSYSAGLGGQYLPTPEGQAFDRAIANLAPLITAVTRVPGVGAMSDYETRLQQAALPSRGTYEDVTLQQFRDLGMLLDSVEAGYNDLLSGGQAPSGPADEADDIDSLLDMYR